MHYYDDDEDDDGGDDDDGTRPNNLCLHGFCVSISRLNISMALLINNLFILLPIPVESRPCIMAMMRMMMVAMMTTVRPNNLCLHVSIYSC